VGFYIGAGPVYSRGRHALSLLLNGSYKLGHINVAGNPRSVPKYSEHYNKSFVFSPLIINILFTRKCIMDMGSRYYVPKINAENKTSAFFIQLGLGWLFERAEFHRNSRIQKSYLAEKDTRLCCLY